MFECSKYASIYLVSIVETKNGRKIGKEEAFWILTVLANS